RRRPRRLARRAHLQRVHETRARPRPARPLRRREVQTPRRLQPDLRPVPGPRIAVLPVPLAEADPRHGRSRRGGRERADHAVVHQRSGPPEPRRRRPDDDLLQAARLPAAGARGGDPARGLARTAPPGPSESLLGRAEARPEALQRQPGGVMPSPGCVFALEQRRWPEMGYARFARFCTGFALWYGLRPFVRSLRSLLYEEGTLPKRAERAYQS